MSIRKNLSGITAVEFFGIISERCRRNKNAKCKRGKDFAHHEN
jgi:hypothetical protein